MSCSPAGASAGRSSVSHGVRVASAMSVAPAATSARAVAAESVHLEGDPDVASDAPADLDPIDERGLGRIGDLERRPPGLEDHDSAIGARRTTHARAGPARRGRSAIAASKSSAVTTRRISLTGESKSGIRHLTR